MGDNGVGHHGTTRIHAVILTRDRAAALERCVNTALSTLKLDDALTVLDDSCARISRENAAVLTEAAHRSLVCLTHLRTEQGHDVIARARGGLRSLWQSKSALRDIAPARNLSLLVSAAVGAHTTVLIDDDICGFDLDATHRMLDTHDCGAGGSIAGAGIEGMSEQDTVTRLSDAMRLLESKTHECDLPVEDLFRVPAGDTDRADPCRWVSAGYMAFRLPATELFAFPPGYNEDWLWCLLHAAHGGTRLHWADQAVVHDPPLTRRSTRDDILFELAGDLILDCLATRPHGRSCRPCTVLKDLGQYTPHPSFMPLVRAEEVLAQAYKLLEKGHERAVPELETYGLSVLRNMLRSGDLEMNGSTMIKAWSRDAAAKHRSFAATLGTGAARVALSVTLQEGRL